MDLLGSKTAPASKEDWRRNAATGCWSLMGGHRPLPGNRVILLTLAATLDLGLALQGGERCVQARAGAWQNGFCQEKAALI